MQSTSTYRRRQPEATVLYAVISEHLSTFLAQADARATSYSTCRGLPRHVRRELSSFLDCGILARGFVRAYCQSCRQSILVAFSCKARAVCPSCTGRRMAEVAAHLVDHVFPEVPVRQWVLSLPHRVRYLLARHPKLCREVRGIFIRSVQSFYRRRARDQGHAQGRCGAVVHTQRFDSALRLDIHWHALVLDGVYTSKKFIRATALTDDEISLLARHIQVLIKGHLCRRGYLNPDLALIEESEAPAMEEATHQAAAIQGLIPFGEHAGYPSPLFGEVPEEPPKARAKKKLCADTGGYSLHAALRVGAGQRRRLERLCRYIARPALAQDRLLVSRDGRVIYRFRKAWRNGKQAVVMDPMTFLSRLAAQVPPPRFHMLSYYGVLAPAAPGRSEIVPGHGEASRSGGRGCVVSQKAGLPGREGRKRPGMTRMVWAELIKLGVS